MLKATLALLSLALLLVPAGVLAVGAYPGPQPSVGITPDSPLWGFKMTFERVRLAVARDPASRAKLDLELMDDKLATARAMEQRGNPAGVLVAISRYEERSRDLEATINGARPHSGMAEVQARVQEHKARAEAETPLIGAPSPMAPAITAAMGRSAGSIERASETAKANAEQWDGQAKEWLREQERLYGMDGGISLVAVYEGLSNSGKVPEGQLNHVVKWYYTHYQLPQSLNGKTFMVGITKKGAITDTVSGRIQGVGITGIITTLTAPADITLTVPSENIQAYIGHMMANDRLAMAEDLRGIGAGKDLIALAGLVG